MWELHVLGTVWDETHLGFSVCFCQAYATEFSDIEWAGHARWHAEEARPLSLERTQQLGVPFNTHRGPSPHLPAYQVPLSCAPDLGWPCHLPSPRPDPWQHPRSHLSSLSVPSPVLLPSLGPVSSSATCPMRGLLPPAPAPSGLSPHSPRADPAPPSLTALPWLPSALRESILPGLTPRPCMAWPLKISPAHLLLLLSECSLC